MNYGTRLMFSICPGCKKKFPHYPEHGYVFDEKYCCSWHCVSALDKAYKASRGFAKSQQIYDEPIQCKPLTQEDAQEILRLRKQGMRVQDICVLTYHSHSTVVKVLKKAGMSKPNTGKNNQIPQEKVKRIRELCAKGRTDAEIAVELGVSIPTVHKYREAV